MEYRSSGEVRGDAEAGTFSGYASRFWSVDAYQSAFAAGAFAKTLAERGERIPVLYQHDTYLNVGVPDVLAPDDEGLQITARLFDDGADGSVLLRRLRQGARYGLSIGFQTMQDRGARDDDPLTFGQMPETAWEHVRVITEARLYEVSVVSFPANEDATIDDVRALLRADLGAVQQVLEGLRAGRLPAGARLRGEGTAAAGDGPGGDAAPPVATAAPRRRDVEIAIARWGLVA